MKNLIIIIAIIALGHMAHAQWNTSGNNIYNTNTGFVGIGNSSPTTLLHVQKNMTEPTITIQNLGGFGGATYSMIDDASGAIWKFKATLTGGFKIRDHAHSMDVMVFEPNSAANAIYVKSGGNIGIHNTNPDASALLDLSSTTQGFLPPRMTLNQMTAISNPANGLLVFNTTENKFYAFIEDLNSWKEVLFGSGTVDLECPSFSVDHVTSGGVAPVNKSVIYGTVTNIPGEESKCWIAQNLGADHQAGSFDDSSEAAAGWYWQFNKKQGYKNDNSSTTPSWTITSIDENSDWTSSEDPCTLELGGSWRLPTYTEWFNVDNANYWQNAYDPFDSDLKLHEAGFLHYSNGHILTRGTRGYYWSSTQYSTTLGWHFSFFEWESSDDCQMQYTEKAMGYSARCIK